MSLNKLLLIGNVGNTPEIRTTQDGKKIASFSVATSERWKSKTTNEVKEKVEWHRVVVLSDGLVNIVEKLLSKGSKVYIEGAIQTRKWQDTNGADKYSTEVILQGYNNKLEILEIKRSEGVDAIFTPTEDPYDIPSDDIPF